MAARSCLPSGTGDVGRHEGRGVQGPGAKFSERASASAGESLRALGPERSVSAAEPCPCAQRTAGHNRRARRQTEKRRARQGPAFNNSSSVRRFCLALSASAHQDGHSVSTWPRQFGQIRWRRGIPARSRAMLSSRCAGGRGREHCAGADVGLRTCHGRTVVRCGRGAWVTAPGPDVGVAFRRPRRCRRAARSARRPARADATAAHIRGFSVLRR